MSPLAKALGIGVSVFLLVMLVFWGVSRLAGRSFFGGVESTPLPTPTASPSVRSLTPTF